MRARSDRRCGSRPRHVAAPVRYALGLVVVALLFESGVARADDSADSLRVQSELTIGGVDLLPGMWLTTEVLTVERPMSANTSVFAVLPAVVMWSRADDSAALGNATLGADGTVARGSWSGGVTESRVTASLSTATATSHGAGGSTARIAERFHSAHSLGMWRPDTTTARAGAELRYDRGRVRAELSLSAAVAVHDTMSFSRADTSAVAFLSARGEMLALERLVVAARLTNAMSVAGGGSERFTHLVELTAGTDWRGSRVSVGVYLPVDGSYREVGIWGAVCSFEVTR